MTDRALTDRERAILELLTAGDYPGSDAARAQIRHATHTGQWSPGDPSFNIRIDESSPRMEIPDGILPSSDRPVIGVNGSAGGGVMLWVADGRIDTFECYWFLDEDRRLPSLDQVTTWDDPRFGA